MSELTGLLPWLGQVLESPVLPWPADCPHMFVRKRAERIDAAQSTLVHLWPESIRRSQPARRYEYLLGRLGAAVLLGRLGVPEKDQWVGQEGRRPLWPRSMVGAIAHTEELLAITVGFRSARLDSLGVDLERVSLDPEAVEALRLCFTARELERLQTIEDGPVTGFSAKEALFKCLSAEAGRYFDFLEAEIVAVDPVEQELRLQLLVGLSPRLPRGTTLSASYRRLDSHVWAGVVWRNPL